MKSRDAIIVVLLLVIGYLLFFRQPKVEIKTEFVTDTSTTRIDTCWLKDSIPYPVYHTKHIKDTVYILETGDSITLPVEQKYYKKAGLYEAWVSGVCPQLDSIEVKKTIEYNTITNTITNTVVKKEWNTSAEIGMIMIRKEPLPYGGIRFTSPSGYSIGANVGYLNESVVYGISLGVKINQ